MTENRLIHVLAANEREGEDFLAANPSLADQVELEIGFISPGELINRLIESSPGDHICLVHSDVYLRSDFLELLARLAVELNSAYPNWGLAGNQAAIPFGAGLGAAPIVRYLFDPQGPPNLAGHILPAQIIGGSLMFLNLEAFRRKCLALPPSACWLDYEILLSVETLRSGLGVFVCPQLALWHDCRHSSDASKQEEPPAETLEHIRRVLKNKKIATSKGFIELDSEFYPGSDQRLDLEMASLRTAAVGRVRKTLAIIIRTRFQRQQSFLNRTISTAKALAAVAGDTVNIEIHIVTDAKPASSAGYGSLFAGVKILEVDLPEVSDSRYRLVKCAVAGIEADYFWFIDDDDWVFPNEAERLALVISAVPADTLIFLDCRHFYETPGLPGSEAAGEVKAGKTFCAKNFIISLTGQNQTPFCGVIYPRSVFDLIPEKCFQTIVYAEDFMSTMFALLTGRYLTVTVDKLLAGISIRASGNTVTERDRRNWHYAKGAIASYLVNMPGGPQLMSLPLNSLMNCLTSDCFKMWFRYLTVPLRRLVIRWGIPHYVWLRWAYNKSEMVFAKLGSAMRRVSN